jgi:O-antigen/teichoic acid export membrane protein
MSMAAAINVLLNILLIPRFGIVGAAAATGLGHLVSLIGLYALSQRVLPIPYERARLTVVVLVTGGMVALAPQVETGSLAKDLLLKSGLLVLYGLALMAFRAITTSDLALLWKMDWRRDVRRQKEEVAN